MAGYKWAAFFLVICSHAAAQINRYVVFFTDKSNSPYSLSQPENFLSTKSLARRAKQNISVTANDLPVNPAYIAQVRSSGAKTYFSSRWMNCVLIEISPDSLAPLQALPFVAQTVFVAPGAKLQGGRTRKFENSKSSASSSATASQLQQLGIDEMQNEGYHGEGLSIAVMDGGFQGADTISVFHDLFQTSRVKATFDFVGNTGNVYQYDGHGTQVLSTMAAYASGFTGGVYAADYYLYVTEDVTSEYRVEEYNWLFAAEKADSAGVDLINTSLGYNTFDDSTMNYTYSDLNGKTTVIARAATFAMQTGMVVVCAAGNEGQTSWHYIDTPADAVGIIACGAEQLNGQIASFSSFGPSSDGRIKPDVVALGVEAAVIFPTGMSGTDDGTSFASPLVASLAAGVWQAFPNLTASQVYEVIIGSADYARTPNNQFGYGTPHFPAVESYVESPDIVSVYPNPTAINSIDIGFKYATDETSISFFDVFGRLLSQRTTVIDSQNNPLVYDVSSLSPGIYLIKVSNSELTATIRFVKL